MHILTHELFTSHEVQSGHPERPERITHVMAYLRDQGILDAHTLHTPTAAPPEAILRAHPQTHLAFLESMSPSGGVIPVDPDTWMGPHSLAAAITAAGALCDAVDLVSRQAGGRAFCAVRPPGHHAERNAAMGFCLINSVAVGALHALQARVAERVAILDFDVHHGNGTVEIFQDHPQVLVCSSFQHPYYPNRWYDCERPNIINTPLPSGTGSDGFRQAIEHDWLRAVHNHAPDLIFISAGFDAHQRDPLADLNLSTDDFCWVTELIGDLAARHAQGRVVSALEGGYDLDALAESVAAHVRALAA